jgi:hypothetical protein
MADTYSWLPIEGESLGRPMYARASYITNFSDMSINLSASELSIGAVTLKDNNSGLNADVVGVPGYGAGLQVLTQDLESTIDDIAIGDKVGNNYATIRPETSSLNVNVSNLSSNAVYVRSVQEYPNIIEYRDSPNLDAFGRLRVSQPFTLLDSKNVYSKNTYSFDEVLSGTATSTFSAYDSSIDLRTSAPGDYVIRQTRTHFNYQPGKSMLAMFTGLFAPEANVVKRVGLFQSLSAQPYEPSDGIFLEVTGNGPVFRVVKEQGTYHTHYAPQSAWNVDKMDGTGPSGININFNKTILFVIDYQWLAVGRIRFGFEVNGQLYYAHYDAHDNELTAPYMTYPNQPARYEIRQTGLGSGLLRQICTTVMTEGGQENVGKEYNIEDGLVTAQDGVYTPLLGLKLNPSSYNLVHIIKQVDLVNTGNKPAHWALFINPTITGGSLSFSSASNSTNMLYASGSGSLTVTEGVSGVKIAGGYAGAGQVGQSAPTGSQEIPSSLARFGVGINGDTDVIVLAAKGLGGSTTLYGSVNLLEKG